MQERSITTKGGRGSSDEDKDIHRYYTDASMEYRSACRSMNGTVDHKAVIESLAKHGVTCFRFNCDKGEYERIGRAVCVFHLQMRRFEVGLKLSISVCTI